MQLRLTFPKKEFFEVATMNPLSGVLYQSGNIDFPKKQNEWAFSRLQNLPEGQQKRIVMNPEVAPLELTRSPDVDAAETSWLERLMPVLNACNSVNLQLRETSLRLRKAIYDVDQETKLVVLISQEAIEEFCREHWQKIAYFYAYRHDGFCFDINTMISMKQGEKDREDSMELVTRVVETDGPTPSTMTFNATGSTAHMKIVDWRSAVKEGESGRFKVDETQVRIAFSQLTCPMVFLYEKRTEFRNHSYTFGGEKLEKQLKRMLRKKRPN